MKFKKLSLLGFKSFANKTTVEFGRGITAIVGPNGCGKSNVADAVRWVLGEQSAKLLRGANMQDIIFNGTAKRKAQSYAEVSLTFDNHNRSLFPSYDYEEVVVSRKLFRSGESEYYINGSLCRLRDISEMLRDAGFAIEGYTIIGQGRVMEIINSKPEDRRSIFEEAAGISKYKYKKNEAERKNARTRDNLVRLNDILSNDTERLGPLARQAEKTRNYNELRARLKHHEINLYINQYETASSTKDRLSAVISDIEAQIAGKQADYAKASSDYTSAMNELQSTDANLEKYRLKLTELFVDKEKISGKIGLYKQQLDSLNNQNMSLMATNSTLNDNYANLTETEAQKRNDLIQKTDELKKLREEYDKVNAKYTELVRRAEAEEAKITAARKALISAMERRAAVNRSVGELSAERDGLIDQIDDYNVRLSDLDGRISSCNNVMAVKTAELERIKSERGELVKQKDESVQLSTQTAERLKVLTPALSQAKLDHSALSSRKKVIEDVQKDAYIHAVRKLLEDADTDVRLKSAIVGVIGRVITVKEGFEAAIDMALGSAVNNVVTKNEEDAKLLVEHLKANKYGRATFLPITSFKPRSIDSGLVHLLNRPGCFGAATEALTYDDVFDPVIRGLLGGTVIVDNMNTAVSLARDSKYGFRIVTLDGDVVTPQGSITGGSRKSDASNLFAHERTLKEMAVKIDELKSQIDKYQAERDALMQNSEELGKRLREFSEDIHDYELAEAAKTAEHNALVGQLNNFQNTRANVAKSLEHMQERLEIIIADLDSAEKSEGELASTSDNDETARIDAQFEALRTERDTLHNDVVQKSLLIVTLDKDVEALQVEIARIKSEAVATAHRIENNSMTICGNNRTIQECDDKIRQLTESNSGGNEKRREEIQAKLGGLAQYKNDLNAKTAESDKARLDISDDITHLTERKHEQEILLTQVDVNMEMMQQRVSDEYGLGYEDCLQFKDENYDAESGEIEVAKLKRRIASLGSINENAIEEAQELSQKCNQLQLQRDDMMKSLADEERIIKEMSANMMRDFDRCFEQIRTNFREIFTELFNGGTADLELTENEDPLLRGVEIKAQPPSKHLQSITLLSGGEKTLTAIAILFSIMKLRPMPFCLLDEIEAALDDANVGRVATTLKKFSTQTQLIAITHRKPTMEKADSLYGVTMEEKGVSSIVSVRLADALKTAETIASAE